MYVACKSSTHFIKKLVSKPTGNFVNIFVGKASTHSTNMSGASPRLSLEDVTKYP